MHHLGYCTCKFAGGSLHRTEIICVGPCVDPKSYFLAISLPESCTPQTSSPYFHNSSFPGPLQTPTLSFLSFTLFPRFLTNSPQSSLPRPKSRAVFSPRYPSTTTSHHIIHLLNMTARRPAMLPLFGVAAALEPSSHQRHPHEVVPALRTLPVQGRAQRRPEIPSKLLPSSTAAPSRWHGQVAVPLRDPLGQGFYFDTRAFPSPRVGVPGEQKDPLLRPCGSNFRLAFMATHLSTAPPRS